MEFGVLGSLQVTHDGRAVELGSTQQRRILAALLLHAGEVVSTDRLIAVLWGDDPPRSALGSLRTCVSRLRDALAAGDGPLATESPGYVFRAGHVDAARFEQLLADAQRAATARAELALAFLDEALGLWRGGAFAEFADAEFARAEAARLDELRLVALELRFEAKLALGAHHELVGDIAAFIEAHPLRERPRAQLMLALYRCGRQAEALTAYQAFRRLLADELGVGPSASLQTLQREVLQQRAGLDWTPPPYHTREDGEAPQEPTAVSLPAPVTSFVGRTEDLAAVLAALERSCLLTLTGVGGVGKTRLALQAATAAAGRYPDGVFWCELAPVANAGAVGQAVATALGARQHQKRTIEDALVEFLGTKRLLLVVDNCEHVVDAAARLLAAVVCRCPQVTVLATSRTRLGLAGEQIWPLAPLPLPENGAAQSPATELFADRARAVRPDLDLTGEDAATVTDICRRLDGLPLAIELAAARMRSLNAADIAERLGDRFRLLTGARRDAAARHQTLRAVVDWSYGLLSRAEQRLFARLSVFAGGFTVEAAERVCSGTAIVDDEVVDLLARLVDDSMVVAGPPAGQVRYTMLETLRQYGRERLEGSGEIDALHRAHAAYYVALAEDTEPLIRGPREAAGVAVLDRELDNLRAAYQFAVSTADTELALRLAAALFYYALQRLHEEPLRWAQRALALPPAGAAELRWRVCAEAGWGCIGFGELPAAIDLAERGLAALGPRDPGRWRPLMVLAAVAMYEGRLDDCLRHTDQAVDLTTDPYDAGFVLLIQSLALTYAGRVDEALVVAGRARRSGEALGNPTMRGWAGYARAEAIMDREPDQAAALFGEAIALARSVHNRYLVGVAGVSATSLQARHGDAGDALRSFREVIELWRQGGDRTHLWTSLRSLVQLLARVDATAAAAVLHAAVLGPGSPAPVFGADAERLGAVAASLGERLGSEGLTAARARGEAMSDEQVVAFALDEIERALTDSGQLEAMDTR